MSDGIAVTHLMDNIYQYEPNSVSAVRQRIESENTLSSEHIAILEDALTESLPIRLTAAAAIDLTIDHFGPAFPERYPNWVETLLSSRDSLAMAYSQLDGITRLRSWGVSIDIIYSGATMCAGPVATATDRLATRTSGPDHEVPGRGAWAAEMEAHLRRIVDRGTVSAPTAPTPTTESEDDADDVSESNDLEDDEKLGIETVADSFRGLVARYASEADRTPSNVLSDIRARHDAGEHAVGVSESGDITSVANESHHVDSISRFATFVDVIVATMLMVEYERAVPQLHRCQAVLAERL